MKLPKFGPAKIRLLAMALLPAGVFVTGALLAMWAYGIRINMTRSLPLGLYLITNDPSASLVAFCPPLGAMDLSASRGYRGHSYGLGCADGAPPLMKPVVALPGQNVAVSSKGIAVERRLLPNTAPLPFDAKHRPLRAWPSGDYVVEAGTLWIASTFHPGSYDSRYLGPIRQEQVLYRMRPFWLFE
jgi:conjugative transfer signal peptidase TraF